MTGPARPHVLSASQPLPPARSLPGGYDRHGPDRDSQRSALGALVSGSGRDWPELAWTELIEELLAIGRTDVPLARLAEGHVDALRILAQAGAEAVPGALYGVWASRSQQTGVAARVDGDQVRLTGTLRFASGAGLIDRALIPVWFDTRTHRLIDLDVAERPVQTGDWRTSAMVASHTHTLRFDDVLAPAAAVGPENFYLQRPGFFPGGIGVAACWVGGAARVLDLLRARHPEPSPAQQLRLGRMRADLTAGAAVVRGAAARVEAAWAGGADDRPDWQALATEARMVTGESVRRLLAEARLATGPAGLALDAGLTHAVHDLELYALQQNSDADATFLGDATRWP